MTSKGQMTNLKTLCNTICICSTISMKNNQLEKNKRWSCYFFHLMKQDWFSSSVFFFLKDNVRQCGSTWRGTAGLKAQCYQRFKFDHFITLNRCDSLMSKKKILSTCKVNIYAKVHVRQGKTRTLPYDPLWKKLKVILQKKIKPWQRTDDNYEMTNCMVQQREQRVLTSSKGIIFSCSKIQFCPVLIGRRQTPPQIVPVSQFRRRTPWLAPCDKLLQKVWCLPIRSSLRPSSSCGRRGGGGGKRHRGTQPLHMQSQLGKT